MCNVCLVLVLLDRPASSLSDRRNTCEFERYMSMCLVLVLLGRNNKTGHCRYWAIPRASVRVASRRREAMRSRGDLMKNLMVSAPILCRPHFCRPCTLRRIFLDPIDPRTKSKAMVPISLATTSGSAALFAGAGSAVASKGTSAAAASLVLPAAVAALRGGGGGAAALAGTAAATETAAKAFDLTRARIRLEGLSAYGVSCAVFSRWSCRATLYCSTNESICSHIHLPNKYPRSQLLYL